MHLLRLFLGFVPAASAWQYISPDALPSDELSSSCIDALVVDLDCPRQVGSFFEREPVPIDSLEEACTSICRESLRNFEASLKENCGDEDVVVYNPGDEPLHVSVVATDMYYHFNRTCIKDDDRWCHIWASENSQDNQRRSNCEDEQRLSFPSPLLTTSETSNSHKCRRSSRHVRRLRHQAIPVHRWAVTFWRLCPTVGLLDSDRELLQVRLSPCDYHNCTVSHSLSFTPSADADLH